MRRRALPLALLLPLTTIVGAVVAGAVVGIEVALLVVAGGALCSVIALLWASVQSLTGETPLSLEEALGMGAPSVEEEQKRAVLRALKDLEFERSVGKITQEDYAELSTRYRAEARRLMQLLDVGGEKDCEAVELLLATRLEIRKAKPDKRENGSSDADTEASATPPSSKKPQEPAAESQPTADESATKEPSASPKAAEGESA